MDSSLSPQYVGDSHVLSLLCGGMWGVSRGFVLIKDGDHHSCKDFWVYFATRDHSRWRTQLWNLIVIQISTSIDLGHGFKKANTLIFLLRMNFCFAAL